MHNKQIFTDGLIFDDNYKVFADAKLLLQTMASSEPVFGHRHWENAEWWDKHITPWMAFNFAGNDKN